MRAPYQEAQGLRLTDGGSSSRDTRAISNGVLGTVKANLRHCKQPSPRSSAPTSPGSSV